MAKWRSNEEFGTYIEDVVKNEIGCGLSNLWFSHGIAGIRRRAGTEEFEKWKCRP